MALLLVCSLVLAGCGKGENQNPAVLKAGSGGTGNQAAAGGKSSGDETNTDGEAAGIGGNNSDVATGTGGNNGDMAAGTGAGGENNSGYVYTPPEMKGEITIAITSAEEYEAHGYLKSAVKSFMAKYPDIKVVLNEYAQILPGQPWGDAYRLNINTRLGAGEAEDIIFTDGMLQLDKYIRMGVPADLTPFIAATPEMNEDNFYMNALTAGKKGESVYVLSASLLFNLLRLDAALVNEGKVAIDRSRKNISFSEAMALSIRMVEASEKQGAFVTLTRPEDHMRHLIHENLEQYIDSLNGVVNINTEEYITLLKQVKELYQDKTLFPDGDSIDFYNDEYYYGLWEDSNPIEAAFYYLNPSPSGTEPGFIAPLVDAYGNLCLQPTGSGEFFLNNASPRKELAWEFIRFLLSEEMQSDPSHYSLPVNRKAAAKQISAEYKRWQEAGEPLGFSETEVITLIDGWTAQVNRFRFIDLIILDWLYQEHNKFFQGEQSAEETAQNLQTKITQYFNE